MLLCNICFLKRKTYNQNISKQFEKKLWNLFGSIGSKTGNGTNHHLLMLNPQHCPLLRPFDGAKWMWYPQIIHFNRVFHYKPSILGCPYFWKHPNGHPFSSTHHDRHQLQESIACRFPQTPSLPNTCSGLVFWDRILGGPVIPPHVWCLRED